MMETQNLEKKVSILGRLKRGAIPLVATLYEGLRPEIDGYLQEKSKNGKKISEYVAKTVGAGAIVYGVGTYAKAESEKKTTA